MDKYKFIENCQSNYTFGFISLTECMYMIIDRWTEDNGGTMNQDELADMVEYIENDRGWYSLGRIMHGYLWGASTDDALELKGEQLRKQK